MVDDGIRGQATDNSTTHYGSIVLHLVHLFFRRYCKVCTLVSWSLPSMFFPHEITLIEYSAVKVLHPLYRPCLTHFNRCSTVITICLILRKGAWPQGGFCSLSLTIPFKKWILANFRIHLTSFLKKYDLLQMWLLWINYQRLRNWVKKPRRIKTTGHL